MNKPLLQVDNLQVEFPQSGYAVDGISFKICVGECFALVGESGSGKSISALSVMRLLPPNARVHADAMTFAENDLLRVTESGFCALRGRRVAMIFQDPMTSLNPVQTIGQQIAEVLKLHTTLNEEMRRQKVIALLQQVEMPEPARRATEYPHQISGGQRQRVMIAVALAGEPDLLIADEPTTALDVTIQAQILQLLRRIQQQTHMSLWLISHDLALVSNMADRVAVMQQGKIVETAKHTGIFRAPEHHYTQQLIQALPDMNACLQQNKPDTEALLQVQDLTVYYPIKKGILKRIKGYVKAVDGVSFTLQKAKTLALVGESGCGKTTLGKGLMQLLPVHSGNVCINGFAMQELRGEALRALRMQMQIIFQDPFSSMNPRMLLADIITEGVLTAQPGMRRGQREKIARQLLEQVELPATAMYRYPHEFSGGQRQRACIARALAMQPKLVICDEPTSALDVSVQAQIITLLKNLQAEKGISYLFITHDLAVVSEIADDVAVMQDGRIIEYGNVKQVLKSPQHPYSKTLLDAVPILLNG